MTDNIFADLCAKVQAQSEPFLPAIVEAIEMSKDWKVGDEFAPYHPSASHCSADYRDGWNACYEMAQAELLRLRGMDGEAIWARYIENVRLHYGVETLVNFLGSVESHKPLFLAATQCART